MPTCQKVPPIKLLQYTHLPFSRYFMHLAGSPEMEQARAHVIVEGRVQGVFFRYRTQEMANQLGVKGWVRNLRGGKVEALFEGEKGRVDQMIEWCHRGPSEAKVTRVLINREDYKGEFQDFSITY